MRLKPFFEGIGTAAGVVWPTFGLIAGLFGLTVGGYITISAGVLAGWLFLAFAVPIGLWSYHNYVNDRTKLLSKIKNKEITAGHLLLDYALVILRDVLASDKITNVKAITTAELVIKLQQQLARNINQNANILSGHVKMKLDLLINSEQGTKLFTKLVTEIKNNVVITPTNYRLIMDFFDCSNQIHHDFCQHIKLDSHKQQQELPVGKTVKIALISFAAAFGSIAGCSAGIMGVLTTVGVIAGVSSIPVVGWAILASAIVLGVVAATLSVNSAQEQLNLNHNLKCTRKFCGQVSKLKEHLEVKLDLTIPEKAEPPKNNTNNKTAKSERAVWQILKTNSTPSLDTPHSWWRVSQPDRVKRERLTSQEHLHIRYS